MTLTFTHIYQHITRIVALGMLWTFLGNVPTASHAEFLRTGTGVYQSTGKKTKVIISQEQPGIFILYGDEIELQLFSPSTLEQSTTIQHVFIKFDPEANRYTGVVVGEKDYRVTGSFTLDVGKTRVTVDNTNPYCSIVVDDPALKEPEVLGLMGLSVIVNYTGQEAVALLEANQFSEYRAVLKPYTVSETGILLNGQPLSLPSIGVALENKNPCNNPGVLWLERSELLQIREGKTKEEKKKILSTILTESKGRNPLKGLLKLRITNDSIIMVDPMTGDARIAMKSSFVAAGQTICTVETARVGKQ